MGRRVAGNPTFTAVVALAIRGISEQGAALLRGADARWGSDVRRSAAGLSARAALRQRLLGRLGD